MRQIILASGSPRRKELLASLGLSFAVMPSDFDEYLDDSKSAQDLAIELGLGKARTIAQQYPEAIVIGADTVVTVQGHHLGKAADIDDARRMWQLATSAENVLTSSSVVMCQALSYESALSDQARVVFKPYDQQAVESYLATGDYADKAGAWSIQQARHLMQQVIGDETTILGLPLHILRVQLAEVGGM